MEVPPTPLTDVLVVVGDDGPLLADGAAVAQAWLAALMSRGNDLRFGVLDGGDRHMARASDGRSYVDNQTPLRPGMLSAMFLDAAAPAGSVDAGLLFHLDNGRFHRPEAELHVVLLHDGREPDAAVLDALMTQPRAGRLTVSQIVPRTFVSLEEPWPVALGLGLSGAPAESYVEDLAVLATRPASRLDSFRLPADASLDTLEVWVDTDGFTYQGVNEQLDEAFDRRCLSVCFLYSIDGDTVRFPEFVAGSGAVVRACW